MKSIGASKRRGTACAALLAFLVVTGAEVAGAQSNIARARKFSWSENAGWVNFRPLEGAHGALVEAGCLKGYVWAENVGWIHLGATGATCPYANQQETDYGVNVDASGNCDGYAWSESAGWINFRPTGAGVTIAPSSPFEFDGYAWGENIGFIHFNNDSVYQVRWIGRPPGIELIRNGGMEAGRALPAHWTKNRSWTPADGRTCRSGHASSCSVKLAGNATAKKLSQSRRYNGDQNNTLSLSLWSVLGGVWDRGSLQATVTLFYRDWTSQSWSLGITPGSAWGSSTMNLRPGKPYGRASVTISYVNPGQGNVWLDDVSLVVCSPGSCLTSVAAGSDIVPTGRGDALAEVDEVE